MQTFVFGDDEVEIIDADYVTPAERVLEFRYRKPVRGKLFASITIPDGGRWGSARLSIPPEIDEVSAPLLGHVIEVARTIVESD